MPGLLPEDPALTVRALTWTVSAAAGAALAAFAGLLGRWSADPALGWGTAAAAALLGAAAGSLGPAPGEDGTRSWAAGGALAWLAVPALLRFLGLALAAPALLESPLGGGSGAAFVLGQAALLAALATGAWTRAARGGGRLSAAAALAGAAAAALAARAASPPALLAAAGLAGLAAAEFSERPWARRAASPLRARAFAIAAALGLALASFAPRLLRDVWMARLHAAYPGGEYRAFVDDGVRVWAAYRFSNGETALLRDGVLQAPDAASAQLALWALIGQRSSGSFLLLVRPPDPRYAFAAQDEGALVSVENGSAAESAALAALGDAPDWEKRLAPAPAAERPNAALVFLHRPPGADLRALSAPAALGALRARLADGADAAVLIPPRAAPGAVAAVARAAAAAFGSASVADLPGGTLVFASPAGAGVERGPERLFSRLTAKTMVDAPNGAQWLAQNLRWRDSPPSK